MQTISVDLVLLRATAPDLPLAVGRVLAARVVERHGERHGILNLAGTILTAELPEGVQAGERLRLVVREASVDRVVLQLAEGPPPAAMVPLPLVEVRLPGGDRVALLEQETGGEDPPTPHVVTLRVESERLGPVELRIALDEELVHARAAFVDGPPLALARQHAGELGSAIGAAAARPSEVDVVARPNPLDVYA